MGCGWGAQSRALRPAVSCWINWELQEQAGARPVPPQQPSPPGSRPPCSHSHAGGQGAVCALDPRGRGRLQAPKRPASSSQRLPAPALLIPSSAALQWHTGHRYERRPARHRRAAARRQRPHRRCRAGAGCRRADPQAEGQGRAQAAPAASPQGCRRHREGELVLVALRDLACQDLGRQVWVALAQLWPVPAQLACPAHCRAHCCASGSAGLPLPTQ